jgi:hypothetical protein
MSIICFDHAFIRNYNYPRIDSLETSVVNQIGVRLHQEEDSVKRRFRNLARQEKRQISLRSNALDGGFVENHLVVPTGSGTNTSSSILEHRPVSSELQIY